MPVPGSATNLLGKRHVCAWVWANPCHRYEPATATNPPATTLTPVRGGTLTIGLDGEPTTLDPGASNLAFTFSITSSVGESLLYFDEHHQVQPWLAEAWDITDGGATFTFKLRRDVIFQDGTPFNAAAVKWNFDRIVDPRYTPGTAAYYLAGYQGTDVVDEFTVRVRFSHPFVPFLVHAGSSPLAMLSPTATAKQCDQVNQAPVTSGQYKIDEWVSKDHVTLSRWDGYTRRAPWSDHEGGGLLDKVVWRFLPDPSTCATTVESGETQVVALVARPDGPRLKAAGIQIVSTPWGGSALSLHLNVTKPPTDDVHVRQAIAYAVDRAAQLTVYDGTTAYGPLTAGLLDDPSLRGYYPRDLARPNQLLDDTGWMLGSDGIRVKNGQRLTFALNALASVAMGGGPYQLLQGQLRQAGIDLTIKAQTPAAFAQDNQACANNGMLTGVRTNELDVLYALFHSSNVGAGSKQNYACLKDPEIDRSLEQGRQELDPASRKQLYLDPSETLLDMAVVVPLVDQLNVFALRPDVHGLKFTGVSYPVVTDVFVAHS
jgi:peptide/nickel transport system substrate-binding protein